MEKRIDNTKGWPFLSYALMAFACLGIELLLAFVLEPLLYGRSMNEWSDLQSISHWVLTCICWGPGGKNRKQRKRQKTPGKRRRLSGRFPFADKSAGGKS